MATTTRPTMAARLKHRLALKRRRLLQHSVQTAARLMPPAAVASLYRRSVGHLSVALCLHRVNNRHRPHDPLPASTAKPADVDALLQLIAGHHEHGGGGTLSMTFDDGYADAVEYVRQRAPAHPHIEWVLFVCPLKSKTGHGFRWDVYQEQGAQGNQLTSLRSFMGENLVPAQERRREDLRDIGQKAEYRLANATELRAAVAIDNISVGNHSNSHFKTAALSDTIAAEELTTSVAELDRLLGDHAHFAFPFGTPGRQFTAREVDILNAIKPLTLWSTEQRPYYAHERGPGKIVPRIIHDGTWTAKAMALWISLRAAQFRAAKRRKQL